MGVGVGAGVGVGVGCGVAVGVAVGLGVGVGVGVGAEQATISDTASRNRTHGTARFITGGSPRGGLERHPQDSGQPLNSIPTARSNATTVAGRTLLPLHAGKEVGPHEAVQLAVEDQVRIG